MRTDDFLYAVGAVEERYLEEAMPADVERHRTGIGKRFAGVAAAVALLFAGGYAGSLPIRDGGALWKQTPQEGQKVVAQSRDDTQEEDGKEDRVVGTEQSQEKKEEFVSVAALLGERQDSVQNSAEDRVVENADQEDSADRMQDNEAEDNKKNSAREELLVQTELPLFGKTAVYEKVDGVRDGLLEQSRGAVLSDTDNSFYRLLGHADYQYLIREEEGGYTLWEYAYYEEMPYSYGEVLRDVYGIAGEDDIAMVRLSAIPFDNSDSGKEAQKEVQTTEIFDRNGIRSLYEIWSAMNCCGRDWNLIDNGMSDLSGVRATRLGRQVTIVTDYGNEIELLYTSVSDMFYEYGGIAYGQLEGEEAGTVRKLMGITDDREE